MPGSSYIGELSLQVFGRSLPLCYNGVGIRFFGDITVAKTCLSVPWSSAVLIVLTPTSFSRTPRGGALSSTIPWSGAVGQS